MSHFLYTVPEINLLPVRYDMCGRSVDSLPRPTVCRHLGSGVRRL